MRYSFVLVVVLLSCIARAQPCGEWLPGQGVPGVPANMRITDMAVSTGPGSPLLFIASLDTGSSGTLYSMTAGHIAAWPTTGLPAGRYPIRVIDWAGNPVIALFRPGNDFPPTLSELGYYRWTGGSWSAITPFNAFNFGGAMAALGSDLYFFGGTTSTMRVYRYNGGTAINVATFNGPVNALATMNGLLYAGGSYSLVTPAGGSANNWNYLTQFDGTTWSAVNFSALNGAVSDLFPWYPNPLSPFPSLIVCGAFTSAGGSAANHIAAWDPSILPDGDWNSLAAGVSFPSGTSSYVFSLANLNISFSNNDLIVASSFFDSTGAEIQNRLDRWSGSAWASFGTPSGPVYALANSSGVVAGGNFQSISGTPLFNLGRWSGSAWVPLGDGTNGSVIDVLSWNGALYACGEFTMIEGVPANYVAYLDASGWHAMGSGMDGPVYALEVFNNELHAGGAFSSAGGAGAANIARWSGGAWQPLGLGVAGNVTDLTPWNSQLVAVGEFFSAGGAGTNRVAAWSGSAWVTFPSSLNDSVAAAAAFNNELYIGGLFNAAGGLGARNHIARWNGSGWSHVGPSITTNGVDGVVLDLAVFQNNLYVGGDFTGASGVSAADLARWDGGAWQAVATTSFGGAVRGLSPWGGRLLVLGDFNICQPMCHSYFGVWDGINWGGFAGTNGNAALRNMPFAAAEHEGLLYFGGSFYQPGTELSASIARLDPAPGVTDQPDAVDACPGADVTFTVATGSTVGYQWQRNGSNLADGGRISGANTPALSIADVLFGDAGTYRCVLTNDCGSVTSDGAPLAVRSPPTVNNITPTDLSVPEFQDAVLQVSVISGIPATRQWRRNDLPISDGPAGASPGGGTVSGAGADTLTIGGVRASDAGVYTCLATNACGEDLGDPIMLTITPGCDPDVNCDGSVNGFDIEATEQAVNGDYSNFCQATADLNNDGAENGFDIETQEQRVNGAPC